MGYNIDGQDAEVYALELLAHAPILASDGSNRRIAPDDPDTDKVLLCKAQLVAKAFLQELEDLRARRASKGT